MLTRRPQVPPASYNQPPPFNLATPEGLRWAPSYAFLRPLGFGVTEDADPTSLEELGFGLVRLGSTKCFRVFQPRPLSVEDGFNAGDNLLVRKIKTEGSNRN